MRTAAALLLGLLLLGAGTNARAQGSDAETRVRELEKRVTSAVLKRDTLALRPLWSEHFMVNSPGNRIAPRRSVVFDLIDNGTIHYESFEPVIEQLRVDGDIAVVMGAETVRPTGKAPLAGQTVKRRFTHIWRKDGGTWQLMARHASIVPQPRQ